MMKAIVAAISNGATEYAVGDLSIPGLRHFLYKSRPHVQITAPVFEEPYDDLDERRRCVLWVNWPCHPCLFASRLVTLYQTLHDAIHAKSGQQSTLKLQYIHTERESVLGWVSSSILPVEDWQAQCPPHRSHNRSNCTLRCLPFYRRARW